MQPAPQKEKSLKEVQEINDYFKEYLKYNNMTNTLECFEAEIKSKEVTNKMKDKQVPKSTKKEDLPRIYNFFLADGSKSKRELNLEKDIKTLNKKYQQILQAGRQIFSVAMNLLQLLHSMKEVFHLYSNFLSPSIFFFLLHLRMVYFFSIYGDA